MIFPLTCPASEFHVTWSPILNFLVIIVSVDRSFLFRLYWRSLLSIDGPVAPAPHFANGSGPLVKVRPQAKIAMVHIWGAAIRVLPHFLFASVRVQASA